MTRVSARSLTNSEVLPTNLNALHKYHVGVFATGPQGLTGRGRGSDLASARIHEAAASEEGTAL